jgi:hypothetical protein
VVARPAFGQQVEEGIRIGNPDAAQNIRAAGEKGVGDHPDGRPDDGDAGIRPGQRQQALERVVDRVDPVINTTSASGRISAACSAGRKNGSSSAFKVAGSCSST